MQELYRALPPALAAPPHLDWHLVSPRLIRYFLANIVGTPWMNQVALSMVVLASFARLEARTVSGLAGQLHVRWRTLFPAYQLVTVADWIPAEHLPRYMNDPQLSDTLATRSTFFQSYSSTSAHVHGYLRSLPPAQREHYQQWQLPFVPPDLQRQYARNGEVQMDRAARRKDDADAFLPQFARLRGTAHLRWNQLHRLYTAYQEAQAQSGQESFPLAWSYEEPGTGHRLHFLLWNRRSFVLAHADHYAPVSLREARRQARGFSPEHEHSFAEFVGAEPLKDPQGARDPDVLLWFGDLLRYHLLGAGPEIGTEAQVQEKQTYLRSWGYGTEEEEKAEPFHTGIPGLLCWERQSGASTFMVTAQQRTAGLLLSIESLYAAATFGLAALEVITTTGARMDELLQISLTPDCLHTIEVAGTTRLLIRLVPKGSDLSADYIVSTETRRTLEKVGHLLQQHYQLQPGDVLPQVSYTTTHDTVHGQQRYPARPYLFQFHHRHLFGHAITACMRFLLHGMVFQGADGRTIALKAHLLRHVFAAHLHHVERVPIDIVAILLHQKSLPVTRYYAAPSWQQVLTQTSALLDRFATHLGSIEEACVRTPAALQQQLEEARRQVGTLTRVPGGECTCHALCPLSFACTGCVFKAPDPARREEIVEQKAWALVRLDQVKRRRLGPETTKMRALVQRCEVELEEMDQIEAYQGDEHVCPTIQVDSQAQTGVFTSNDTGQHKSRGEPA